MISVQATVGTIPPVRELNKLSTQSRQPYPVTCLPPCHPTAAHGAWAIFNDLLLHDMQTDGGAARLTTGLSPVPCEAHLRDMAFCTRENARSPCARSARHETSFPKRFLQISSQSVLFVSTFLSKAQQHAQFCYRVRIKPALLSIKLRSEVIAAHCFELHSATA